MLRTVSRGAIGVKGPFLAAKGLHWSTSFFPDLDFLARARPPRHVIPIFAAVTLPFLQEIVAFLVVCTVVAYGCHYLGLAPIMGFLITGALIGPNAAGLVGNPELVETLAEVGVILLLFEIGVEFSLRKLSRLRRTISIGGSLQVGGTLVAVTVLLVSLGIGWRDSFYTAALVTLSSTAVVLGLLSDRGEIDTPQGQLSLSVLIYQDLAIIPLVLIIPLLGGARESLLGIAGALGTALLVIALVLVLAWYGVPPILHAVARTQRTELFVLAVIAIALATAWLVSLANVSLALGAFLAGLVVSESEYREQALSEVLPFRTVFTAFFFVSVGMLLNPEFLWSRPLLVAAVLGAVLLLKGVIATASAMALGYPVRIALATGVGVSQVGEFSFVLERAGQTAGLTPAGMGPAGEQLFIATAVILMMVTPGLFAGGRFLARTLQNLIGDGTAGPIDEEETEQDQPADHVVIVGYGPGGRHLAEVLDELGAPFTVLDLNPESVEEARASGYSALYGDATTPSMLRKAGIRTAKLCVVVINDDEATYRITQIARHENPTLQIVVRTSFLSGVEDFREAGADFVVAEEMEATMRIYRYLLEAYRVPAGQIDRQIEQLRRNDYEPVRSGLRAAHRMVLEGLDEEGLHTRAVRIRPGAPVAGRTLGEVNLRKEYDLTVLAVRRGEDTFMGPSGSFELRVGDRLVLVGSADQFARTADLFRPTEKVPPSF